jgi:hypothetical protein
MKRLTATNEENDSEMFSARDGGMRSLLFCLGASLAGMSVLVGCDHTYYRSLSPSQTAQDCFSDDSHVGSCFGLPSWGGACQAPDGTIIPRNTFKVLGDYNNTSPGGEAVKSPEVGCTHKYNAGTQPFPCTDNYVWISRAYVSFDLSTVNPKIGSLVVATLSWEPTSQHYELGWAKSKYGAPHCFQALWRVIGPWQPLGVPGEPVTSELDQNWAGVPPQKIAITPAVKKLLAAGGSRLHLCFTGDESQAPYQEWECYTTLKSLTLNLTYTAK